MKKRNILILVVALSALTSMFSSAFAQPPTNALIQNTTPFVDANSNTMPFGAVVQIICAGANNVIDPPHWGDASHGMVTGDDFVIRTDSVGTNEPPIPPFAGLFTDGFQVYSSPVAGQVGIGMKVYVRIFNMNTVSGSSWYTNSNLYTTTGSNGETATVTEQTSPLASGSGNYGSGNPNVANNPNGNGSQLPFSPVIPSDPATNNQPPAGITFPAQGGVNTNPSSVTVSYTTTRPALANDGQLPPALTLHRYWSITPSSTNFTNATLQLHFTAADLPAGITNPVTQVPPLLAAYTQDGGLTWTQKTMTVTGPNGGVYTGTITGLNHFSTWAITDNIVLPVELNAFSASMISSGVHITWSTQTETNNGQFILERQTEVNPFEVITQVPSHSVNGNSSVALNYSYNDNHIQYGTHYHYRLSDVSVDGHVRALRTIEVTATRTNGVVDNYDLLEAYPNPFNPATTIRFNVKVAGNVRVAIYNLNGELVKEVFEGQMGAGMKTVNFDGSKLASGIYILHMQGASVDLTTKISLMK